MRAESAGARVGRSLRISPRAPVLVLRRKTVADDGLVKEVVRVWFCSDGYEFVSSTTVPGRLVSLFDIRNVGEQTLKT
jgi:DNA-binding GntR family transcriptional regulator